MAEPPANLRITDFQMAIEPTVIDDVLHHAVLTFEHVKAWKLFPGQLVYQVNTDSKVGRPVVATDPAALTYNIAAAENTERFKGMLRASMSFRTMVANIGMTDASLVGAITNNNSAGEPTNLVNMVLTGMARAWVAAAVTADTVLRVQYGFVMRDTAETTGTYAKMSAIDSLKLVMDDKQAGTAAASAHKMADDVLGRFGDGGKPGGNIGSTANPDIEPWVLMVRQAVLAGTFWAGTFGGTFGSIPDEKIHPSNLMNKLRELVMGDATVPGVVGKLGDVRREFGLANYARGADHATICMQTLLLQFITAVCWVTQAATETGENDKYNRFKGPVATAIEQAVAAALFLHRLLDIYPNDTWPRVYAGKLAHRCMATMFGKMPTGLVHDALGVIMQSIVNHQTPAEVVNSQNMPKRITTWAITEEKVQGFSEAMISKDVNGADTVVNVVVKCLENMCQTTDESVVQTVASLAKTTLAKAFAKLNLETIQNIVKGTGQAGRVHDILQGIVPTTASSACQTVRMVPFVRLYDTVLLENLESASAAAPESLQAAPVPTDEAAANTWRARLRNMMVSAGIVPAPEAGGAAAQCCAALRTASECVAATAQPTLSLAERKAKELADILSGADSQPLGPEDVEHAKKQRQAVPDCFHKA